MKENVTRIKFAVFADLHYKKGMYIASVEDLESIMTRAHDSGADFVLHVGDMCNDYRHSPELVNAYLHHACGLPVYGVYGNHELETKAKQAGDENSMQFVTPLLCNRRVVWGTADGKLGDGSIGYYYFDRNGFRIIGLDTNYSWNVQTEVWEHNDTGSHGAPAGNEKQESLGPTQLAWLKRVLQDAVEQELHCVLLSHSSFSGVWKSSPDHVAVRALIREANAKRRGTVLMALNGHYHTNHQAVVEDVVYFDVNTVRNTLWLPSDQAVEHYEGVTYAFADYDANGNETSRYNRPVSELRMGKNTWFSTDPISAIVTVSSDGSITVEGQESSWLADIVPEVPLGEPLISNGSYACLEKRAESVTP